MKSITLMLTVACTLVGLSSCCCQTQGPPPLRPMPKYCEPAEIQTQVPAPIEQPTRILPTDKGK